MEPYLALLVVLVLAYIAMVLRTYDRARDVRVVHCPAAGTVEAIRLRTASESLSMGLWTAPHVARCSLWPARKGCAQECLAEVNHSPEHCAFQLMLAHWYRQKSCVFCHREIPPVSWGEPRPALLAPDGRIVDWTAVAPTALPEVLHTHTPICARCGIAETFRLRYPDRIVERPARPEGAERTS